MGSVRATCGHLLEKHDGPHGLGWRVKYDEYDGTCLATVCTECLLTVEHYVPEEVYNLRERVRELEEAAEALRAEVERLKAEAKRISEDYIPEVDADAPLALAEMREAIAVLAKGRGGE